MIDIKELKNNKLGIFSGVGLLLGGALITCMGVLIATVAGNHNLQSISFGSLWAIAGLAIINGGIQCLRGVKFNITVNP